MSSPMDAQAPRRPGLPRLALGLAAGWVAGGLAPALAVGAMLLAMIEDPYSAQQQARFAALALSVPMGLFMLTGGVAIMIGLLAAGRRAILDFAAAGAAGGALFGVIAPMVMGDETNLAVIGVLAVCGLEAMLIARAVGGVRKAA